MKNSSSNLDSLGLRLKPLFDAGFFRPLGRPSAPVYVDCATRLIEASLEGELDRAEARALVREVIETHPDIDLADDEGGYTSDPQQKANQFFNQLLDVNWISEHRVSISDQRILMAPLLRYLLRSLTGIAENRPEELKDFGNGLHSLCQEVLSEGAFDPRTKSGEALRIRFKDLLDRAGRCLDQMHAVESLIREHEAAQRQSGSAQETLKRFLDDIHVGEQMICYDALRESGLLPRIERSRSVLLELSEDPLVCDRLAQGHMAHSGMDEDAAHILAEESIGKLTSRLGNIPHIARQIDARMSEFNHLSAARYRYQTEMRGIGPEKVKAYCDHAAMSFAGKKFSDLSHEPGMIFRTVQCEVLYGVDALAKVRAKRLPVNLKTRSVGKEKDVGKVMSELGEQTRLSLTPQRASRFITKYLPNAGDQLSSDTLLLESKEELMDFLSVMTFDRSPVRCSTDYVKWRVRSTRQVECMKPKDVPVDHVGYLKIERINIEREH